MSAYLDGLVRRGAGLGAAPGEQMAALRPLSRFEQPAFAATGAGPGGLAEQESLISVVAPPAVRAPAGEHAAAPRPAIARAAAPATDASPPVQESAPSRNPVPAGQASVWRESNASTAPVRPEAEAIEPTLAVASPAAPPRAAAPSPAERAPTDGPDDPQQHTPDVTLHSFDDDASAVAHRPTDVKVAAAPDAFSEDRVPRHMPVVSIDDRQIDTMLADDHASERAFVAPPDQLAPEPDGEVERTPPMTIAIGRIEIDFGQRPPAPAPAQPPQRTRGFEAYARARRGQLR